MFKTLKFIELLNDLRSTCFPDVSVVSVAVVCGYQPPAGLAYSMCVQIISIFALSVRYSKLTIEHILLECSSSDDAVSSLYEKRRKITVTY
jgi:hypothetical protein